MVLSFTLAAFIYIWMLKPVEPLYEASALVEIGQNVGGKKDSIAPILVSTVTEHKSIHFKEQYLR